jgi:hypothetical protein
MLAHRQIIVRAPYGDRLGPVVPGEAAGIGKRTLVSQDLDENPITPLTMEALDRLVEDMIVIQRTCPVAPRSRAAGESSGDLV